MSSNVTPSRVMEERFEKMGPALRQLAARRLGLNTTQPRILAEMLRSRSHVQSTQRRLAETRAWDFVSLLVERGGAWLPREERLEDLAARLRGWFPVDESSEGWRVEPEVAHAMARWVVTERFALATLLGRAEPERVEALLRARGIEPRGAPTRRLARLCVQLVEEADERRDVLQPLVEETAQRGSLRSERIAGVRFPDEHRGLVYDLTLIDGTVRRVAARELMVRWGVSTASVDTLPQEFTAPSEARLRIPSAMRGGALLTFRSATDCDSAMRVREFADVILYRLDACRVLTREDCDHRRAQALLQRAGWAEASSDTAEKEVLDASR